MNSRIVQCLCITLLIHQGNCGGSTNCGTAAVSPLLDLDPGMLVGGDLEATPNSWPWTVSLQRRDKETDANEHCGGSLIRRNYVLMAAHCKPSIGDVIYIGAHDRTNCHPPGCVKVNITEVWEHPDYTELGQHNIPVNDVAVVRFSPDVQFGATMSPVCLPASVEEPPNGTVCYLTGWGNRIEGTAPSNLLRQTSLRIGSQQECATMRPMYFQTDSMICTTVASSLGRNACRGDGGGPLVCQLHHETQWKLFGVASWGSRHCVHGGRPGVYARVTNYVQWIDQICDGN